MQNGTRIAGAVLSLLVAVGASVAVTDAFAARRGHPQPASAPTPVQYFDARALNGAVELTWIAFSDKDVAGFRVYRKQEGDCCFFIITRNGLIPEWQQNYTDADVQPDTTYEYLLGVVLTDGSEYLSREVSVTTPADGQTLARR